MVARNRLGGVMMLAALVGPIGVGACGSSDEGGSNGNLGDDAGADGSQGSGGAGAGGRTGTGGATFGGSSSGGAPDAGNPDASQGGAGGSTSAGGSGGGDGGVGAPNDGCPTYHDRCNGICIPTSDDPANCGTCGNTCSGGLVCSGGVCSTGCLPGLDECAGACVDFASRADHCGSCNNACGPTEGCVNGTCKPTAVVGPDPAKCQGGGPPIDVTTPTSTTCSGNVAATTFTWALCSCTDVRFSSESLVDGFDSTQGPYVPGELGGGVGANGLFRGSSRMDIWGDLWIADTADSAAAVTTSSTATVHHDLRSGSSVNIAELGVSQDAYVDGDVNGGPLTVDGTLHLPTGAQMPGSVSAGSVQREPVVVSPPCACEPSQLLPIASIVTRARTNNDNDLIGLQADLFTQQGAPAHLDLPCGHYYLDGITAAGATTIVVHGRTALYIGGDIDVSAFLSITIAPGAQLDLFVGGTISGSSTFQIGNPNYPAMSRTYIAGTSLELSANALIASNIYAPNALVRWTAEADVFGSVFARDFEATARLGLHFDRHVVRLGDDCPPPGGDPDGGAPGAGGTPGGGGAPGGGGTSSTGGAPGAGGSSNPPPGCGSCRDCNNQACIDGACSSCTSSAQCCPPLVCNRGTCMLPIR